MLLCSRKLLIQTAQISNVSENLASIAQVFANRLRALALVIKGPFRFASGLESLVSHSFLPGR